MEGGFVRLIVPAVIAMLLGLYFCKKPDASLQPANRAEAFMSQGKWKVTYFIENGNDKSAPLKGYEFDFRTDGSALAISRSNSVKGAWTAVKSADQDKLVVTFVGTPTDILSKTWQISEVNNEKIHLINQSESRKNSHLVLEKIKIDVDTQTNQVPINK